MMRSKTPLTFALLASTALTGPAVVQAGELPTGGSVAYGAVSIATQSPGAMTIRQSSQAAIVNWQGFSVGQGNSVAIQQPSSSAALLNRVTGTTTSTIAGQISANGQVYLVNPNGIVITPTGSVRAGGFVASTLGISDDDFKAGRRTFSGSGQSASVVNRGAIEIGPGGYAALIGGAVDNAGTISVPLGRVGLGAGERATLDLSGDGFLQVSVPSSGLAGSDALIQSSGKIRAPGGRVEIKAATARDMARNAINLSGTVEARSVGGRSGAIVLGGGAGGRVTVSGRLAAAGSTRSRTAARPPARGGSVTVTGQSIALTGARIDASGGAGGGTVRIGGDLQGQGTLQRAEQVTIDAATRISANALAAGDGGSVVVWSDRTTTFDGVISARGGPDGGKGGFAEVSGKETLVYGGMADLSAPIGAFGTLLLDPFDVFIEGGANANNTGSPAFTPTGNNSVINAGVLQTALGSANVVITTGAGGSQSGDITVGFPVTWTANTLLTLTAARNIVIGAPITGINGGLSVGAGAAGTITTPGTIATAAGGTAAGNGSVSVGKFTLTSGAWTQVGTATPFAATDFSIPGGSFLRALGGAGTSASPYQIADVYGLQGIGSSTALLSSSYILANPIDAAGTAGWTGGGFVPIGGGTAFSGTFDGAGNTISGLTINRPTAFYAGLFGHTYDATLRNVVLTAASISGGPNTGGLVGYAESSAGSSITASSIIGSVTGAGTAFGGGPTDIYVGGLVGRTGSLTTVSGSSATATVTATGNTSGSSTGSVLTVYAGGLIGQAGGAVSGSSAATTLSSVANNDHDGGTANNRSGGLIGTAFGTVASSQASGTVQASGRATSATGRLTIAAGGLVGFSGAFGGITRGTSRAAVTAAATGASNAATLIAGGLVGTNVSTVNYGTATGNVTVNGGAASNTMIIQAGGLVGFNTASITASSASGSTTISATAPIADLMAGGFAGQNNSIITNSIATGAASATASVSGVGSLIDAGGFAGVHTGTINTASAIGVASATVSGTGSAAVSSGGFVGRITSDDGAAGTVTVATAKGAATASLTATGTVDVGGFVGNTIGTVTQAYATGAVTLPTAGTAGTTSRLGGFVGNEVAGSITASFWDTQTTGQLAGFGQNAGTFSATGLQTLQFQDPAVFVPLALAAGWNFTTTWAPPKLPASPGFYPDPYAIEPVIRVDTDNATRLYGAANPAFPVTGSYGGPAVYVFGPSGDSVVLTGSLVSPSTVLSPVGTYPIRGVDAGVTSALGVTYRLVASTTGNPAVSPALSVTPAPLTVTANNQTKVYGSTFAFLGTEFTTAGLLNADTVTSATLTSPATPATAAFGSYAITPSAAVGTGLSNYTITYAPGTFSVTQAPLTVTASNQTKTYGNAFAFLGTEFTTAGLLNADTVTSATLSSLATPATAAVGSYGITASGATGTGLGNYTITYAPGTFAVTPAPLTVTASNQTKTYGNAFAFLGNEFTTAGLRNTDTVTSATLSSLATPATAAVGSYAVTAFAATGTGLSNYTITYAPGTFAVTPAALTVTASNQTKTYGNAFTFLGTEFTAAGLRNTDTVASATLSSLATPATAAVGSYGITASAATGTGLSNYTITYAPGSFAVTPAPLVITPSNQSKVYGNAFTFLGNEFTSSGLRNADTVAAVALSSAGTPAAALVGSYGIATSGAAGTGLSNYTISYGSGSFAVTPAPLTIRANDQTKTLGTTLTFAGTEFTATGLRNTDTVSSAALASTGAPATAPVGLYAITVGSAVGAGLGNYAITYQPGTLNIPGSPALLRSSGGPGNPVINLPVTTVTLPTYPDTLPTFPGGSSGGGPTIGVPPFNTPSGSATVTLGAVEKASTDLEQAAAGCEGGGQDRRKNLREYTGCLSDALESFAKELDGLSLDLPRPLRGVSAVIREAARKVRVARSFEEARTAVRTAVAEVRKAIALIRADDPAVANAQVQQGDRIANALGSVETRLARAVGL